jgi:hypothetical protein
MDQFITLINIFICYKYVFFYYVNNIILCTLNYQKSNYKREDGDPINQFNTFPLFYAFYAYSFPPHLRFLHISLESVISLTGTTFAT